MFYDILLTSPECSTGTGDSGCGTRKYFTSSCGRILVATAVTTDRNYCEWIIDPAQGMVVNLTFNEFNIPDTGKAENFTFSENILATTYIWEEWVQQEILVTSSWKDIEAKIQFC